MNKTKETVQEEKESLEIIGFKIFPGSQKIDFFTVIIYVEDDRPITKDKRLLFCTKLKLIPKIIKHGFPITKNLTLSSCKPSLICNINESIRLIESEDIDDSAIILNSLNIMFDLVKSTEFNIPNQYNKILFSFADHLTFERSISNFFEQENIDRKLILDAFLWCIGAIFAKSKIIHE
jgi:hypothetical protein